MSDGLRRILVDAGLDPCLHGGVDGAVLLLVGRWREAEASKARFRRGLESVRDVGRSSGTNLNAWNQAFDIIDAALGSVAEVQS